MRSKLYNYTVQGCTTIYMLRHIYRFWNFWKFCFLLHHIYRFYRAPQAKIWAFRTLKYCFHNGKLLQLVSKSVKIAPAAAKWVQNVSELKINLQYKYKLYKAPPKAAKKMCTIIYIVFRNFENFVKCSAIYIDIYGGAPLYLLIPWLFWEDHDGLELNQALWSLHARSRHS